MTLDIRGALFYTAAQVSAMFGHGDNPRWIYRASAKDAFLRPYRRHFGKGLYFDKAGIDRLIAGHGTEPERRRP